MAERTAAPEEVVILCPELVGSPGEAPGPARVDLGPDAFASRIEVELDIPSQGLAPLVRAAETVLRQGKRYVAVDLRPFRALGADEVKALAEARERCARAHGMLLLYGASEEVAGALAAAGEFETAADEAGALARARARIEARRQQERRAGDLEIDTHVLPLGKKKGDESFVEGYRRKGPEGISRELVVLELDEKGPSKVAEKVRQLAERKLTAFVIDLSNVPALDGNAIKDLLRAKRIVEERGGYLTLAGAKHAVAGLLKVMNLERDIPSHPTREKAIEDFKEYLLDHIEAAEQRTKKPAAAGAAAGPEPEPAPAARERKLAIEESGNVVFLYSGKRKPSKKDLAGDTNLLALSVRPETAAGLADAVRSATERGTNRIVVDLGGAAAAEPALIEALRRAADVAREKKARVVFAGASGALASAAKGLDVFDDEAGAMEALALEILSEKNKKGVKFCRTRSAVEAAAREERPRTEMIAAPSFEEEAEEREEGKTQIIQVPSFEETEGKTKEIAVPEFEGEEAEEKPRTQMLAVPSFAEEEGEQKPKTQMVAVPSFDEDEGEKKPKTQMLQAPAFDEEEEKKPAKTQMIAAPAFEEEEKAPPPRADIRVAKTEAMPGLSREEALKLAEAAMAEAAGEDVRAKKTEVIATPPPPPPAPPMAAPPSKPDLRVAKTEAMPGLSRDEARKLVEAGERRTGEAPAAPSGAEELAAKKTEVIPGMSRADAENQVRIQTAKTEAMPGLTRAEAEARVAADAQVARTQVMGGLGGEEAERQAVAERSGGPGAEAETRRSPLPLVATAIALVVAAVLVWKGPEWFGGKPEPAPAPPRGGAMAGGSGEATPAAAAAAREKALEAAVRTIRAASEAAIETE